MEIIGSTVTTDTTVTTHNFALQQLQINNFALQQLQQ